MMSRLVSRSPALLASALVLVLLAGCASTEKKEYLSDASRDTARKTLEVPPDLVSPGRDDRFQTPTDPRKSSTALSTYSRAPEAQSAAAATLAATPDVLGKARVVRSGNQRWLVLPGTPAVLYPQLRKFWEDLGFTIAVDAPQLNILETDWAEKRSKALTGWMSNLNMLQSLTSTGQRDKFRTRIEAGQDAGTVEIYVSHRGLEEANLGSNYTGPGWILRPADPDQELEMLRRMMITFGSDAGAAALATKSEQVIADKSRMATATDGNQQLVVDEIFDRAWRQIGLSLDRIGMVVEDRDRTKGLYFVRYITDEDLGRKKDSSWFSWMAFWRSEDKKSDVDQYRIVVQAEGSKTTVRVQNKAGAAASPAATKQILSLLNNELK